MKPAGRCGWRKNDGLGAKAPVAKRGTVNKRWLKAMGWVLTLAALAPAVRAATPVMPATGPSGLGGPAAADSLRTNLWLCEALMGEIVAEAVDALPPAPARVLLTGRAAPTDLSAELLRIVSARVLKERGYEVLVAQPDSMRGRGPTPDYTAELNSTQVALTYPDVGRTLGLWRSWVDRELVVVVTAQITENSTGRLLLSERMARHFTDRVTNDEFPAVNSTLYPFTNAEPGESGWQRRLEEFAVLGTLAGLVAVYFANTGD